MRAVVEGSRNFESRSSDGDNIRAGSPLPHHAHMRVMRFDRYKVQKSPLHLGSLVVVGSDLCTEAHL
ncbi:hypothetical protein TNCV_3739351 [Trichonephila clavipes]|nr:hypothetical protein TNCV_3739351 [Trichonephila clavipes]